MSLDPLNPTGSSAQSFPAPAVPDASLAAQSSSANAGSSASDSPDPLMTALQQTLSQLAGGNSGDPLVRHAVADANISLAAIPRSNNPAVGDVETTGAQLLAALYRALALQENSAAVSGVTSPDANGDDSMTATVAVGAASSGSGVAAYTDLASRIASLSDASRAVVGNEGSDSLQWDDFADTTPQQDAADASSDDGSDPMTAALSNLNDALQAHLAALDQDSDATASLPDVLDALSGNTVGMSWQPVGVVVDLTV